MADMIEQFDFVESARTNPNNYPWPQWTNGSIYKAIQNVDFKANPKTFAYTLLKRAKKLKMGINRFVGDDYVIFQFCKKDNLGNLIINSQEESAVDTKKLTSFNFKKVNSSKYPWEQWTNGGIYKAQQGEDFTKSCDAFMSSLRHIAKKLNLGLRKERSGTNSVVFQFYTEKEQG